MQRQADAAADMAFRGGEAMVQEAEMSRQATLLGMQYGSAAGANQAVQQGYANQMYANQYANQMQMQNLSNFSSMIGQIPPGTFGSGTMSPATGAGGYTYNPSYTPSSTSFGGNTYTVSG